MSVPARSFPVCPAETGVLGRNWSTDLFSFICQAVGSISACALNAPIQKMKKEAKPIERLSVSFLA